ncbi:hypothetical protein PIB30_104145 [Stylosanthes scabra]|uniref:E3 ubiquitin protein ligase DRIP2 n=1 Tax=Stylosanthes scabra TaxID=79078 RepID=A0ABU6RY21_9FABA|nr:hypothetical protein [Stylosanthes scabra]
MAETTTKSNPPTSLKSEVHMPKAKNKDNRHKRFGSDKEVHTLPSGKQKRPIRPVRKRAEASEMPTSDKTGSRCDWKNSPIWFSLVASEDQKGDVPLPQISACYLRIKDGTVPVSFIQKYLVKKLNLTNEAEVEIMCRGQPVLPNLQLHNLVDLWFCTPSASKKMPASVGSSAKDFVMVLSYCRKAVPH